MVLASFRGVLRAALAASLLLSCSSTTAPSSSSSGTSGTPAPPAKPDPTKLFNQSIKNVVVEIDYAPDAAPNEAAVKNFGDPWDLFNANSLAIFDGKKTVRFPRKVKDMQKLDDVPAKNFSGKDLLDIAAAHRDSADSADTATFYVVFVNGYYLDESGAEQKNVLGVSVGGSGVIGIFKPAVTDPIIEQVALVHEFGHAVGFVDNGVPVADNNKSHIDKDHPGHCTNKQCAMYFSAETLEGAKAYASTLIRSSGAVLYGQECLSDARIFENQGLGK